MFEASTNPDWWWGIDLGVSPGIVVGRLQLEGVLPPTHGNKLKRWLKWDFER